MIETATTPVTLHVYAVSVLKVVQCVNMVTQNMLKRGGIFHGAVEVHGQEWSYGYLEFGTGIWCNDPKMCEDHTWRESVYLGDCMLKPSQVSLVVKRLAPDWNGRDYDIL